MPSIHSDFHIIYSSNNNDYILSGLLLYVLVTFAQNLLIYAFYQCYYNNLVAGIFSLIYHSILTESRYRALNKKKTATSSREC